MRVRGTAGNRNCPICGGAARKEFVPIRSGGRTARKVTPARQKHPLAVWPLIGGQVDPHRPAWIYSTRYPFFVYDVALHLQRTRGRGTL